MAIQDKALVLQEAQALTGGSASPYRFSNSVDIASVSNVVRDVGQGYQLWMEFEVTTAFTGFGSISIPTSASFPTLVMGVALATTADMSGGTNIIATVGWPLTFATGVQLPVVGMCPTDATGLPRNLYQGDVFRCAIPGGVIGLPWFGNDSQRFDYLMHASGYLSAVFFLPMCTGQTPVNLLPTFYTADNFTTGAITSRIVIGQPVGDAAHSYRPGMRVS